MEILQVTLPEVVKTFTKWHLLCNLQMEGPWKQDGIAIWGAGNCLLVATACKGSTATELEVVLKGVKWAHERTPALPNRSDR